MWLPVKNFPLPFLIASLPWIVGRNLMVLPYYALKGKGRVALLAKWNGLRGLPGMIGKRKTIVRKVPEGYVRRYINMWAGSKRA
jgi:hypothetical protein